jgi:Ca-activated chloride channel family protein
MRGLDTTRLKNSAGADCFALSKVDFHKCFCLSAITLVRCLIVVLFALLVLSAAGDADSRQTQSAPPPVTAPASPSSQQQSPPDNSQQNGTFVIRKDVDEVVLHATVIDDKDRIVTNLTKNDFAVFEDGKPQTIISFHHEDIPVAMGILIDNSGSMREKRAKVNAAALNLVRSSNPQDEVFVVNFNDEYYLDQDFTNNLLLLKDALDKIDARGGTALYEALVASADNFKNARLEQKVLFVVTDGEDNASRETLEQAVKQLQQEGGPSVYAIGILGDEEHPKRAKRALEIIAERTGGLAFFPRTLDEVDEISRQVAHDIRNTPSAISPQRQRVSADSELSAWKPKPRATAR